MSVELLIVLALVLLNGFLALSEMAVMTARKSRLRQAARDSRRAQVALDLAEQPERFLSSVQVWITLLSILTGYLGGEGIARTVEHYVARVDLFAPYAHRIAVAISVGIILFVSVVLGELVPKRLAIVYPERIATIVAIPMRLLATAAKPIVVFLAWVTEGLLRLVGARRGTDQDVTEEEIKLLVAEGAEQGVIDNNERNMVNRVLSFGDRTVDSLMTPRTRIAWLDIAAPLEENLHVMRETPYSRYPVCRGSEQDVVGVLQIKSLMDAFAGRKLDLFRELSPPMFVPETARALHMIERFRDAETNLALVVDEYGDITGLVTLNDLLIAVFGRMAQSTEAADAAIVQREDGSWLIDGGVGVDDLRELLALTQLPHEAEQDYRTAAGLMMAHFGRIPAVGEAFSFGAYRFEVVDLDGARIDKVLVARTVPPEPDNIV
ncbi:MAG TPA: hemolysin family protein [Xanthomonadales bacterium]|nr:hemolysin family protein [Xanthomonadales bacterium]